jgi:hypothetical protein
MVETTTIANDNRFYIKLIKNSKNYNWEIKGYEAMDKDGMIRLIEQIESFNAIMINKFGGLLSDD